MKYMYENQSTKLNYSRRLDIIKHYLRKTNKKKIAKNLMLADKQFM